MWARVLEQGWRPLITKSWGDRRNGVQAAGAIRTEPFQVYRVVHLCHVNQLDTCLVNRSCFHSLVSFPLQNRSLSTAPKPLIPYLIASNTTPVYLTASLIIVKQNPRKGSFCLFLASDPLPWIGELESWAR